MALLGSVAPEFCAVIAGSFHFVMWPRKMLASVGPSSCSLLRPDRLYAIEMTPSVVGTWTSALEPPGTLAMSASPIGTSLAPKSTVPFWNCEMPAPEPTDW